MVGLVPTIHVFASQIACGVQDVDARHKGEHDELEQRLITGSGLAAALCRKITGDRQTKTPPLGGVPVRLSCTSDDQTI
jgi:hypothetical protein